MTGAQDGAKIRTFLSHANEAGFIPTGSFHLEVSRPLPWKGAQSQDAGEGQGKRLHDTRGRCRNWRPVVLFQVST